MGQTPAPKTPSQLAPSSKPLQILKPVHPRFLKPVHPRTFSHVLQWAVSPGDSLRLPVIKHQAGGGQAQLLN